MNDTWAELKSAIMHCALNLFNHEDRIPESDPVLGIWGGGPQIEGVRIVLEDMLRMGIEEYKVARTQGNRDQTLSWGGVIRYGARAVRFSKSCENGFWQNVDHAQEDYAVDLW